MIRRTALPRLPSPPAKEGPNAQEVERVAALRRDSRDVAAYVAHMTAEMSAMSRAAGHDLLAYFLDMARIEANIQAERPPD